MAGVQPQVTWESDYDIIGYASEECDIKGVSLEEVAGVAMVQDGEDGDCKPERDITWEETLDASLKKLGDDGRLYSVYRDDGRQRLRSA